MLAYMLGISTSSLSRMRRLGQMPVQQLVGDGRPRFATHQVGKWLAGPTSTTPAHPDDWELLTITQARRLIGWSRAVAYRRFICETPPVATIPMGFETRVPLCRIRELLESNPPDHDYQDHTTEYLNQFQPVANAHGR